MANVGDVAAYILDKAGRMPAMKLQKLVYYSQAWHLVWEDHALFADPIEAWRNGPVVPALYKGHRGSFDVAPPWPGGDPNRLEADERSTVDAVLEFYGDKSAQWLSDLTHSEDPWTHTRQGLAPQDGSKRVIPLSLMAEYYEGISHLDPE